MAETPGPIGRRLLAATIDHIAENEPNRSWVSVPVNEDLSHGFKDISFKQFAEAINRAAWWLEQTLGVNNGNFETFAYAGEKDVRFPILAVAAIKVGRKVCQTPTNCSALKSRENRYFWPRLSPRKKLSCIFLERPNVRLTCIRNQCTQRSPIFCRSSRAYSKLPFLRLGCGCNRRNLLFTLMRRRGRKHSMIPA